MNLAAAGCGRERIWSLRRDVPVVYIWEELTRQKGVIARPAAAPRQLSRARAIGLGAHAHQPMPKRPSSASESG